MKKYLMLIATAIIILFSACQGKKEQSNTQDEIVGVYQMTGNREGMAVMTEKYYVYAARSKNESSTVDSIDYYKNEYNSLRAEVCTWTRQDSIITCTYLFDKDSSKIGQSWRFTYSFKGDTILFIAYVPDPNNPNNEVIVNVSGIKVE